jgi:DNA-binding transcriptional regulator PaaX
MARRPHEPGEWLLLCYRLPREPSTPRITVWRKLKRAGVAQLADGLVTLPADARTREQLDWIAEEITQSGGEASIWLARPSTVAHERQVAAGMTAARVAEYTVVIQEATAAAQSEARDRRRTAERLRAELRRIGRRDYFPPPERESAQSAVQQLWDLDHVAEADGAVRP